MSLEFWHILLRLLDFGFVGPLFFLVLVEIALNFEQCAGQPSFNKRTQIVQLRTLFHGSYTDILSNLYLNNNIVLEHLLSQDVPEEFTNIGLKMLRILLQNKCKQKCSWWGGERSGTNE